MGFSVDKRLLVKIAYMYHEEGATQSQIAQAVGVSRSLISKYLTKAKDLGIVEIVIHEEESDTFVELESLVEQKYSLKEVICVPNENNVISKNRIGQAASRYLLRVLEGKKTVGISSGTTLYEVANTLTTKQVFPDLRLVPLAGGMGDERVDIHANQIVAKLASKLGANYNLLHAPVVVDSEEAKNVIVNQRSIKNTFQYAKKADIAIVGIGGVPQHSFVVKSYKEQGKEIDLENKQIVGDICYNFINEDGKASINTWNNSVISLDLEHLKHIPLIIGVAGGLEKVEAIKAAIKGGLIHVLVTDNITAQALID